MSIRTAPRLHQHRGHAIVTKPEHEPISIDELCWHLELDASTINPVVAENLTAAAREWIEEQTGIAMLTQTWRLTLDRWPTGQEPWWDGVRQGAISELAGPNRDLEVPRYPLVSIDSVTTYDEGGTAAAVTVASVFDVDTYSKPGRMALRAGATWPVALRPTNAIEVQYTAGYGEREDVPQGLRQAVTLFAAYLWENRGCDLGKAYVASGAAGMASRYSVARL